MTCSKCRAEGWLGINTRGVGKHAGSYISGAFRSPGATLESAIEKLREPPEQTPGYEAHWERWARTKAEALQALLAHREVFKAAEAT